MLSALALIPELKLPTLLRQPIHVVYGGAHLFREDTFAKLAQLARRNFETHVPTHTALANLIQIELPLALRVHEKVKAKLLSEPVEDFRVDFEDGFGQRSDVEEDAEAARCGTVAAQLKNPLGFFGIRIKPLTQHSAPRALKTLELFLAALSKEKHLLPFLLVTIPKVTSKIQVEVAAHILESMETKFHLPTQFLKLEIMIESAQGIYDDAGAFIFPQLFSASKHRLFAAHFGAYDYTASLGISASEQYLGHPACDSARHLMQLGFVRDNVFLSDGATTQLPVAIHRETQLTQLQQNENEVAVVSAMQTHARNVTHALKQGFTQGWDLHPAQIPIRYAATFAFFLKNIEATGNRLKQFVSDAAKARVNGTTFDDAATGLGLLNVFLRAIQCGAISEEEAQRLCGLTNEQLTARDFSWTK
jgi:citrate lyase beta subunit